VEAEQEKGDDSHTVVSGTFTVNAVPVKVLFDAGAMHSFTNPNITARMSCTPEELDICLCVSTPIGSSYQTELIVRNCEIIIKDKPFLANLILLGICGYDVILGMDWLAAYHATIDCKHKLLTVITPEGENIVYNGNPSSSAIPIISATKICKLIKKGCVAYLCVIEEVGDSELEIGKIPVVREFPEVF